MRRLPAWPWKALRARARPWPAMLARAWHLHAGRPGGVALVLLFALALVQWQLLPLLQQEQALLQSRQLALAAAPGPLPGTERVVMREPLQSHELPGAAQRGRDLEWLVGAAARSGLTLDRADYALGAAGNGPVARVEATLPLSGSYAGLRQFVAAVLNEMPHAALESLQVERPNTQSPQLQATARLVLFYRTQAR